MIDPFFHFCGLPSPAMAPQIAHPPPEAQHKSANRNRRKWYRSRQAGSHLLETVVKQVVRVYCYKPRSSYRLHPSISETNKLALGIIAFKSRVSKNRNALGNVGFFFVFYAFSRCSPVFTGSIFCDNLIQRAIFKDP